MTKSIYTTITNPYVIMTKYTKLYPSNYISYYYNPYFPHTNSCDKTQTDEKKQKNNRPNVSTPNNAIHIPSIPDDIDNTKELKKQFSEIKFIYDEMNNGLEILCDFTTPEEEKIKKEYMELNEKLFNLE